MQQCGKSVSAIWHGNELFFLWYKVSDIGLPSSSWNCQNELVYQYSQCFDYLWY